MSEFIKKEEDYAIRIVAFLAGTKDKVKIEQISEKLFINKPMVVKIIHRLSKCGIVGTMTGKNGGIYMKCDLSEVSLYDILYCMGLSKSINACVNMPEACKLNPICTITSFFAEIQKDVLDRLKSAKIEKFVFDDSALKKVGGIYE